MRRGENKTKFIITLLLSVAVITAISAPFNQAIIIRPHIPEEDSLPQKPVERPDVISSYDSIMRRVALDYGYDWRLISAVAYAESRFDGLAESNAGARGVMQITPIVAKRYGIRVDSLYNPSINIELGVRLLSHYGSSFSFPESINPQDRISIVLASYNCGIGHVYDARRLALVNGENHNSWAVVQKYLRMKSDPEIYNDSINVRCGRFDDYRQTIGFVNKVMSTYKEYCSVTSI